MRRRCTWLRSGAALAIICAIAISAQVAIASAELPAPSFIGEWSGTLGAGTESRRLVFHVTRDRYGKLSVSIDSLDDGDWGVPAEDVSARGDLRFDVAFWRVHFSGAMSGDGKTINGTWTQGEGSSLTMRRDSSSVVVALKPSKLEGDWAGLLRSNVAGSERLAMHIRGGPSGALSVWVDDPGRNNAMGIACDHLAANDDSLSFEVPLVRWKFAGKLGPDGDTIVGTWRATPLIFSREKSAPERWTGLAPLPASPPVALDHLKLVLDREFAPTLANGLLQKSAGGGVAIGVLDRGERRIFTYGAARPDSLFDLASVTKTFTGLMLAQLVEQKKVTLDEPLRLLLPPGIAPKPKGPEITLADLATHHAGLPRLQDNFEGGPDFDSFAYYDDSSFRAFFEKHGIGKPANAKFEYSNLGFELLGYALERSVNLSYPSLLEYEITGPLKLHDIVASLSGKRDTQLIQGYTAAFEPVRAGAYQYDRFAGAGAVLSTAPDLLTYLDANLHPDRIVAGAAGGSPAATMPAALKLQHQLRAEINPSAKIGLAWIYQLKTGVYFHDGGAVGYSSHVEFDPARDRAIVVLYNRLDDTPGQEHFVDCISNNIKDLMDGKPAPRIDYVSELDRITMSQSFFSDRDIQGSYHCRVSSYSLPISATDPFNLVATGDMSIEADGKGNFVSGAWEHQLGPPKSPITCRLKLKSGTYSVSSNGTGSDTTTWELMRGIGEEVCAPYFPAGREIATTAPQLIVTSRNSGIFYTSSMNPLAMTSVVCQR